MIEKRDEMVHTRSRRDGEHIPRGDLEEIQNSLVLERRRVRDVYDDLFTDQGVRKTGPGERVHAGGRRSGGGVMAKSAKAGNELLSDEARGSDDDSGGGSSGLRRAPDSPM